MTERIRSGGVPSGLPLELRSSQASVVDTVDFTERVVRLLAVPYGERAQVIHLGRVIEEEVQPGAFDGILESRSHITANRDHDHTRVVGKAIGYDTSDPRGFIADVKISQTPLGDETLRLADDGVLRASVGMFVKRSDQSISQGVRRIRRAFLDHIAFVPNPAYAGAEVLSVRQAAEFVEAEQPIPTPELDATLADPFIQKLLAERRNH